MKDNSSTGHPQTERNLHHPSDILENCTPGRSGHHPSCWGTVVGHILGLVGQLGPLYHTVVQEILADSGR